jgi:hypothetical protein
MISGPLSDALGERGGGSSWRHGTSRRTPCASEPERCPTNGRQVVINQTVVGVVWTMEGLLVRGMMVAGHLQHSTKSAGSLQQTLAH